MPWQRPAARAALIEPQAREGLIEAVFAHADLWEITAHQTDVKIHFISALYS